MRKNRLESKNLTFVIYSSVLEAVMNWTKAWKRREGRERLQFPCVSTELLGGITCNNQSWCHETCRGFTCTFSVHNVGISAMIWLKPETWHSQAQPGSHESKQGRRSLKGTHHNATSYPPSCFLLYSLKSGAWNRPFVQRIWWVFPESNVQ